MERTIRVQLAAGGVVLALGIGASIITSTIVASRAYERRGQQAQSATRELSVKGSARQRVVSDQADWIVTVRGEGKTLAEAYGRVEAAEARVRALLTAAGFPPAEVESGPIETGTRFERNAKGEPTNTVESYELARPVQISTAKVDLVAATSGEVTKLLKENVQVVSSPPRFSYSKLPEMRITLAGEAAKDARARAEELAGKSGGAITGIRSVSAGPIQVTQPNSTNASSFGSYDTSTIAKDVWMSVSATFGVENR